MWYLSRHIVQGHLGLFSALVSKWPETVKRLAAELYRLKFRTHGLLVVNIHIWGAKVEFNAYFLILKIFSNIRDSFSNIRNSFSNIRKYRSIF